MPSLYERFTESELFITLQPSENKTEGAGLSVLTLTPVILWKVRNVFMVGGLMTVLIV